MRNRPLTQKEVEFSDVEIIKVLDNKMIILMDPYEYNGPSEVFKNRSREQHYTFDYVFDDTCNQVLCSLLSIDRKPFFRTLPSFYWKGW